MRPLRTLRCVVRTGWLLALLVAATVDGQLRHRSGRLRWGAEGAVWIHGWSKRIVRAIGVHCTVEGEAPVAGTGRLAVVSNHLSYLDILLYSSITPFVMVAKSEVRGWPLLGWLTAQAGTVYVDRGGRPETYPTVNAAMSEAYRSGLPVLFFPEGTTTDGEVVLEFRRGLFHSVLHDRVAVRTAALAYALEQDVRRCMADDVRCDVQNDVCWWGDAEFVPHLFRLLGLSGIRARVRFGDRVEGEDRFVLAQRGRAAVAAMHADVSELLALESANAVQRGRHPFEQRVETLPAIDVEAKHLGFPADAAPQVAGSER